MSTSSRRARVGAALPDGVDALLVTALVNVRYLTGFTGSNGAVLLHRDGAAVLATDGRYRLQAQGEAPDVELLVSRQVASALVERAIEASLRRLGFEAHVVTVAAHAALEAAAGGRVELVDVGHAVEQARVVKDEQELATLGRACAVTDEVFAALLDRLRPGVSEREISWHLRAEMNERGAVPGFDSIVAFGPNAAIPHHQPTDRPLARGDLVKLDFGAEVEGYHADMTRTVVCGPAADWQRDLHALVAGVQAQGRAAAVPGAVPVEVDADVRRAIEAAGHEFPHGLGHGVGLEIHESPFVVPNSSAPALVDGVPVTIEPGIYLTGRGGVRVEDTVVVRAGGAQSLTTSPRELLEI